MVGDNGEGKGNDGAVINCNTPLINDAGTVGYL